MAFTNKNGQSISYNCSELIEELKQDINEFGGETLVNVWCKEREGVTLYINYDFINDEEPVTKEELNEAEFIKVMTMSALLVLFETQNSII